MAGTPETATSADFGAIQALVRDNECLMAIGKAEGDAELTRIGTDYVANVLATEMVSWESLQQRFEPAGRGKLWVLREKGSVVGCIGVVESEQGGGDDMELVRMYVDQSCRRRGFGRILVSALVEHVTGLGVKRVTLTTPSANRSGIGFYESVGFTKEKVFTVTSSGLPLELSELVMAVQADGN